MLKKLINTLTGDASGELSETRRRHGRVEDGFASIELGGFEYIVKDWSQGGAYFSAVNQDLKVGDTVEFKLKFALPNGEINIPHSARIIRKTFEGYAVQFTPLTRAARENFVRVMDGVVSRGFEQSAIATYH